MSLADLVSQRDLLLEFAPSDKWEAIRLLVDHVVETYQLADRRDEILEAVLGRERSLSTGLEQGIALPHAALEGLDRVLAGVGVLQRESGVQFESIDGRPVRIVVLLLVPKQQKLLHIRTLKEVALTLAKPEVRAGLLGAKSADQAYQALLGAPAKE